MCYNVFNVFVITCHNVFTFLPVWPRDTQRLDTPVYITYSVNSIKLQRGNDMLWGEQSLVRDLLSPWKCRDMSL